MKEAYVSLQHRLRGSSFTIAGAGGVCVGLVLSVREEPSYVAAHIG
jgi:hypothetical protein